MMSRMMAPSSPISAATVTDMPRATPAWGSRVMPRYLQMFLSHFMSLEPKAAPAILPAEREMM